MRVLLTSEQKFERTPDGTVWAPAAYGAAIWSRYLDVFSEVVLTTRVVDVERASAGCVEASCAGVTFKALPPYSGLRGLVRHGQAIHRAIREAIGACEAVIVRSPSPIAYAIAESLAAAGRPYGAQIVGDPDQVFSQGAFRHPLWLPLRHLATAAQARLSRHATAVLFVTRGVLQGKYPTRGQIYSGSDVVLDDPAFAPRPARAASPFTIVTVGSLDQPYKGTAVLLDALAVLRQQGLALRLAIVGGGRLLPALRERAHVLELDADVDFLGQLDRTGVRRALDAADLFVIPSLTEGLPRALLEAMAKGLPAIGSDVGGIPELLPPECLVPPGDAGLLAERIRAMAFASEARRAAAGERNRSVARAFHDHEQSQIRHAFLLTVRDACGGRSGSAAYA